MKKTKMAAAGRYICVSTHTPSIYNYTLEESERIYTADLRLGY